MVSTLTKRHNLLQRLQMAHITLPTTRLAINQHKILINSLNNNTQLARVTAGNLHTYSSHINHLSSSTAKVSRQPCRQDKQSSLTVERARLLNHLAPHCPTRQHAPVRAIRATLITRQPTHIGLIASRHTNQQLSRLCTPRRRIPTPTILHDSPAARRAHKHPPKRPRTEPCCWHTTAGR